MLYKALIRWQIHLRWEEFPGVMRVAYTAGDSDEQGKSVNSSHTTSVPFISES